MTADGSSFRPTESLAGDLVIAVISRGRGRGEFWSLFTTPQDAGVEYRHLRQMVP